MLKLLLKKYRTAQTYRRLFMDKEGKLKPEAEEFLVDLYGFARFFKEVPLDPQTLAGVEGGRQVVRHIIDRLNIDTAQLRQQIQKQMKGSNNE